LLSSFKGGSTVSLAKRDLTDVGISGALHTGLGFFGLLNAEPATLPCGWGGHEHRGPGFSFSMFCIGYGMDLGPLCYTGSSIDRAGPR
jgi:hypothetical protein